MLESNGQTDPHLAAAARGGDVESFGKLYERHYGCVVAAAYAVLGDRHLAQDAAQEAFAIACRDIARLKRTDRFAGWVRGICRNVAMGVLRSRRRRALAEADPARGNNCPDDDGFDESVRRAVMRLPAPAREVVLMHYFSGMSHQQIADVLDVSPQAVHGRLVRARRKIASRLAGIVFGGRKS